MTVSMYTASVPVMKQMLGSLSAVLDKGMAFAEAKKIDPSVLLDSRLAPDMFALARQVQIATDQAKGCIARLAGVEMPKYPDDETTFDELKTRIAKTIAFIESHPAAAIDGTEDKTITLTLRAGERHFTGQSYLLHWALPQVIFHVVTAYDILRHNGVDVGKRDFIGSF
jgi:hypothetical protein